MIQPNTARIHTKGNCPLFISPNGQTHMASLSTGTPISSYRIRSSPIYECLVAWLIGKAYFSAILVRTNMYDNFIKIYCDIESCERRGSGVVSERNMKGQTSATKRRLAWRSVLAVLAGQTARRTSELQSHVEVGSYRLVMCHTRLTKMRISF